MWLPCIRVPFVFERENDLIKTIVQLQKKRTNKQTKGVRNNSVLAHALRCTPVKRANTIIIIIIKRRGTRTSERGKHRKPKMRKSQLQSMQHNYTSVPEQELLDQKKKDVTTSLRKMRHHVRVKCGSSISIKRRKPQPLAVEIIIVQYNSNSAKCFDEVRRKKKKKT